MSLLSRIQFMTSLVKNKITGGSAPLVVVINTTFRCNLRCGYCYGQYFQQTQPQFTLEELNHLIDELARLGTRSITLGGGEPLIRDDIGDVIRRIKSHGIECGFNTNGTLVPKRIEELRQADSICVSLDGPREMNDLNRGEGSFDKIMAGIDAALDAGITVHTSSVITRHNVEAIDWMVDLAREKGMQAEFNFLFHQSDDKSDSDNFMAETEMLRDAAKRIADLKAEGAPILFSESVYRMVQTWPDHSQRVIMGTEPDFEHIPCSAGRFMTFVDADGLVYPCVQLIGNFPALDFREVGVEEAWRNCIDHSCKACYFPCFNELNQVMRLDVGTVAGQAIKTLMRR